MSRERPRPRRARMAALAGLVLVSLVFVVAACAGSADNDTSADDDAPLPRPPVTSTAYVPTTLRVNYHTDVIVFMDPTSGSQELQGVEAVVASLPAKSALLITSEQAYNEAKCLFAGQTSVMDTLDQNLVPTQFRLDFGGDQTEILEARLQLQALAGVARVTGDTSALTGPGGSTAGTGAPASSTTTTAKGATAPATPTACQAEGIRIK